MLKNNKLNLLISIIAAIALWAYISTAVNPATERTISSIPVELVNIEMLNDRGFTVNESMTNLVDITVSGPRSEVAKLSARDFRATADMTGYRKGDNAVPVKVIAPQDIEIAQVRPEEIYVTVVDLVAVNKPVRLEFTEDFPKGEEPGFIEIVPEEMEVSGVAEVVDSIDYIRALISNDELTEEVQSIRVDVVAINKAGQPVYNVGLSQNSVEITVARCSTKQVPLHVEIIGAPNESIEVTDTYIPSYITIRGAKAAIADITEIECGTIDLSGITSTVEIPIEPHLPKGVEVANASRNLTVRIEVQGIVKEEFEYTADMIEVANLAPSFSGHVNTGSVIVTVFAIRDVAEALTRDDIKLSVDAAEYRRVGEAIEMEVIATCEIEAEIKEISVAPAKVRVTLTKED